MNPPSEKLAWLVGKMTATLEFHKGTVSVTGNYHLPNFKWDERGNKLRALGLQYRHAKEYLERSEIPYEDKVLDLIPCPELSSDIDLRDYQQEALKRWKEERWGTVVLPTGGGKTYIGIAAIEEINAPTFITVPTLDLVRQWKEKLCTFNIEIGEFTGERKQLEPITVSTYDSAYIHAENLGNKFKLLIFDEVHHLPSEGYRTIAQFFVAPYRLGLTATYERSDGLHKKLPKLVGGKIFEMKPKELAEEKWLSNYQVRRIWVDLTEREKERYEKNERKFVSYLKSRNIALDEPSDFQKIVLRSGSDPEAWEAIKARTKAKKVAYGSENKITKLGELLKKHENDRVIIFTRYNEHVYRISRRYLIPAITHKTKKAEREELLEKFKRGEYSTIVSSQVLDEGIDVPAANIGVILSGTGSNREYIQRLGRILRPAEGKREAILYECISSGTSEFFTSERRRNHEKRRLT